MNKIQQIGKIAEEAFKDLKKLQTQEERLLKTGEGYIDCHIGGMLPGDVVIIAGAPGTGKSETLYRLKDKLMSADTNEHADGFVELEFSMEIKMLNKILRKAHILLDKAKSAILFNPFTKEEREVIGKYYSDLQDGRRYVVQEPVTPQEFYDISRQFCIDNAHKKAVVISADHLLLFTGKDKQKVLEEICEYVNLLKLEFNNVYFFLLSQLNRGQTAVIKERSNDMIPNNSLLFGSSFMEYLASYIVIITNPYKLSVSEYLRVNPERYSYLEDFFSPEEDSRGRVSFNTLGNLFYFVTKTRESDVPWKDLFIKKMDLTEEQLRMMEVVKESNDSTVNIELPTFDVAPGNGLPIFDPKNNDIFD